MSFYLAIDAGGTKTDYVLANDSEVLARVRTGTIKRMRTDAATAGANLDQALKELTAATGVAMGEIQTTCVGTAGETVPLVADWLREAFAARVGGELLLLGDVEIALDAAFFGKPGVLIMAGTGSNVAGRAHTGALTTVGGWGPALADQGSGHRIGLMALRGAFRAIDELGFDVAAFDALRAKDAARASGLEASEEEGQSPALLLRSVMNFWQLPTIAHLVEYGNAIPAPDFSRLTALVVGCAQRGDAIAKRVLVKEAQDLADLAILAMRRVQQTAPAGWVPPVAFTGSILENVAPVHEGLMAGIRAEFPEAEILPQVVDPILGALWRARTLAGVTV